jgi:integrase
MLTLTVNTGLPISELIGLATTSIHTGTSPYIECEGKGPHAPDRPNQRHEPGSNARLPHRTQLPARHCTVPRPRRQRALARRHRTAPCNPRRSATKPCPSIGSKHVTTHTLRHATALNLLHAGVDITVIALWLGHEKPPRRHGDKERRAGKDQTPRGRPRHLRTRPRDPHMARSTLTLPTRPRSNRPRTRPTSVLSA